MADVWEYYQEPDVQKVGYKTIVTKYFVLPDGRREEFTTVGRIGTNNIATIAITKDQKVIVARQFRPGPERILEEIPGGGHEHGETLEAAALRELMEETGYTTDKPLVHLGEACRDAYVNEVNNYFLATECYEVGEQQLDDTEVVEVAFISIDKLIENAKTAQMSDSVAVLMAIDYLQKIKRRERI